MKLLGFIKNACVVFGIISIGDMYSMELEKKLAHERRGKKLFNYPHTAERFMRELPLMSKNLILYRYNRCNEEVKKEINQKFTEKENLYHKVMFSVGEAIIGTFVIDKQMRNVFLNIPVRELFQSFENSSWALKVSNGEKAIFFINSIATSVDTRNLIKKKLFKNGYIARYADQIKKVDCYLEQINNYYNNIIVNSVPLVGRNTLVAFDLLNKIIKKFIMMVG